MITDRIGLHSVLLPLLISLAHDPTSVKIENVMIMMMMMMMMSIIRKTEIKVSSPHTFISSRQWIERKRS